MAITRYGDEEQGTKSWRRLARGAAGIVAFACLALSLFMVGNLMESVDQDEIMVIQAWRTGAMTWYTNGGVHWQKFGTVTKYPKRGVYQISTQVRFNDGGHGTLKGSVQYVMPLDEISLSEIHRQFKGPAAVQAQLIETVVVKAVYMTGPLMSSKESYAEKRNDLISFVEDQIQNGVYRTRQRQVEVLDQLTGQKKNVVQVEIVQVGGQPARQEDSVLTQFKVKTFNFSIKDLAYDPAVEKQIQQQQQIVMDVQTSMAEATKAAQRKLTIEQQGSADVAKARFEQEVIKQKEVTTAEQRLAVAVLANKEADQYRETQLKRADADATYRRRIMEADGALSLKLDAYVKAQQLWSAAFEKHSGALVPTVMMGGTGAGGQNAAMQFMDLLGVKFARDLALDLVPAHDTKKP